MTLFLKINFASWGPQTIWNNLPYDCFFYKNCSSLLKLFRSEDLDFAVRLVQEALNSNEKDGKGVSKSAFFYFYGTNFHVFVTF